MYERFFQYLRAISSIEGSLNQGRISACTGHCSFHISTHGTCTNTDLFSSCPLTPGNSNLIIWRSFQKYVLVSSASGKKRSVALVFSSIDQCGNTILSPPPDRLLPPLCAVSCSSNFARISAKVVIYILLYLPLLAFISNKTILVLFLFLVFLVPLPLLVYTVYYVSCLLSSNFLT